MRGKLEVSAVALWGYGACHGVGLPETGDKERRKMFDRQQIVADDVYLAVFRFTETILHYRIDTRPLQCYKTLSYDGRQNG